MFLLPRCLQYDRICCCFEHQVIVSKTFSQRLLNTSLSPVEPQFYTSVAAGYAASSHAITASELSHFSALDKKTWWLLLADGVVSTCSPLQRTLQ